MLVRNRTFGQNKTTERVRGRAKNPHCSLPQMANGSCLRPRRYGLGPLEGQFGSSWDLPLGARVRSADNDALLPGADPDGRLSMSVDSMATTIVLHGTVCFCFLLCLAVLGSCVVEVKYQVAVFLCSA